ncbi:serine/threonine kinase [Aureococcus anophagefferens]|nr:serine/threonine kinase [Aureococcus anophagefferens]
MAEEDLFRSISFDEDGLSAPAEARRRTFDDVLLTESSMRGAMRVAARRARSSFREQRLFASARRRLRPGGDAPAPAGEADFAVEASVGAGSFGEVFRVRKVTGPDCGRRYAMKKIAGRRQEAQERRMLLAAEHPFVVRLRYAFATADGASCLVMDFASRGTLEGHLNKRAGRRLDVASAKMVAAEVGHAILCLHGLGVVHRDVKPANVLVDAAGHCLLSDLGLATVSDRATLGRFCGTLEYVAPEQLTGARYGGAVDLTPGAPGATEAAAFFDAPFFEDLDWRALGERALPPPLPKAPGDGDETFVVTPESTVGDGAVDAGDGPREVREWRTAPGRLGLLRGDRALSRINSGDGDDDDFFRRSESADDGLTWTSTASPASPVVDLDAPSPPPEPRPPLLADLDASDDDDAAPPVYARTSSRRTLGESWV